MNIGVIGTGRLGLSFALLCDKAGYNVIVSDTNEDYINNLNQGLYFTDEPFLLKMIYEGFNLTATTNNLEVISNSDIIFTFVPTPPNISNGFDTTSVFEISNDFFTLSNQDISVFNKKFVIGSTMNPGDVEQIQKKLSIFSIQVAYCPTFGEEGEIVKNIQNSDIILIGTEYQELANNIIQIYSKIQTSSVNAHILPIKSSEITKLAINSYVSLKNTFSNVIGDMLLSMGLKDEINSVLNVISKIGGNDKRDLKYGFGFGGPYQPKDNISLSNYIDEFNSNLNLPLTIDNLNKSHISYLKEFFIKNNPDKSNPFVIDGLSYNGLSNNIEESQKYKLCIELLNEGYFVNVIESEIVSNKLINLSEQYEYRLKFYKSNTKPEGYPINLDS